MAMTESAPPTVTPQSHSQVSPVGRGSRIEPASWLLVVGTALGVGVVAFLATELMHYILVPDIGRSRERLLAEGLSALIVSLLTAKLVHTNQQRHRLMMARMQVIGEMNHHIRNALSPVSLSIDATQNQQLNGVISEAVDRIDWALREILPREVPLAEEQRDEMWFFQRHKKAQAEKRHSLS
jgi:signal transduction histidine kinase